jgi:hypothetical protein
VTVGLKRQRTTVEGTAVVRAVPGYPWRRLGAVRRHSTKSTRDAILIEPTRDAILIEPTRDAILIEPTRDVI